MHNKQTHVIILLSFLDFLAVSMVIPQLGLRIRELGASQFTSGLISSVYGAIQLFSSTFHGMSCDKFGRRSVLLICLVFITTSYVNLAVTTSFFGIIFFRSLLGLVKHTQSSFKIIGGDINSGAARTSFISKTNTLSGLAFMIGPFFTAFMFDNSTSFKYGGLGCSSIFVVVTIISYLFVEETLTEQSASKENKKSKSFSKSSLLLRFEKYKSLRVVFVYRFCAAFSVIILRYFTPLYTQHYFGFDAKHAGYMTSFNGFAGIICSWVAGYVALFVPNKTRLLQHLSLLLVFGIASTLLSATMPAFLATQFLLSFVSQNLRLIVDSLLLSSASNMDRGEIFGIGASIIGLCRVCGPLVAGTLAEIHMMLPLVCSLCLAVLGSGTLFYSGDKVISST